MVLQKGRKPVIFAGAAVETSGGLDNEIVTDRPFVRRRVSRVLASSAQATERRVNYTYTTWLRSLNDPSCWYRDEGCSPWDYWTSNWVYYGSVGGHVLQGFENNSVIRGTNFVPASSYAYTVYPGDYSMGGYLKANVLWWSGGDTYIINTEAYHP